MTLVTAEMFPESVVDPSIDTDERYTPSSLFLPLHKEFGFTLDVCATAESAKCPRYFTKAEDGLKQSWRGERCWGNVPFSDIEPWVEKTWFSRAELVVLLTPATRTEQPWWQKWVEPCRDRRWPNWSGLLGFTDFRTRNLPGRISFGLPGNPEGVGVGSPMFGCVLLIWSTT